VELLQLALGRGLALAGLPLLARRQTHLEQDRLTLPLGEATEEVLEGQQLLGDALDRVETIAAHEYLLALELRTRFSPSVGESDAKQNCLVRPSAQKCVYAYHLLELFDALLDLGLFHGVLEDVGIDAGREDVDRHHVAVPFHTLSTHIHIICQYIIMNI
jgi:hypothetical protein